MRFTSRPKADNKEALLTGRIYDSKPVPVIKEYILAIREETIYELDEHLSGEEKLNRKNGKSSKTIKTSTGEFNFETSRDRNVSFEPQTVKKYQTRLIDEMECNILSLLALGSSYQAIRVHIRDMFGTEISKGTINAIIDKLVPELHAWQRENWSCCIFLFGYHSL